MRTAIPKSIKALICERGREDYTEGPHGRSRRAQKVKIGPVASLECRYYSRKTRSGGKKGTKKWLTKALRAPSRKGPDTRRFKKSSCSSKGDNRTRLKEGSLRTAREDSWRLVQKETRKFGAKFVQGDGGDEKVGNHGEMARRGICRGVLSSKRKNPGEGEDTIYGSKCTRKKAGFGPALRQVGGDGRDFEQRGATRRQGESQNQKGEGSGYPSESGTSVMSEVMLEKRAPQQWGERVWWVERGGGGAAALS